MRTAAFNGRITYTKRVRLGGGLLEAGESSSAMLAAHDVDTLATPDRRTVIWHARRSELDEADIIENLDAMTTQLHALLIHITDGESFDMINSVEKWNGLEG